MPRIPLAPGEVRLWSPALFPLGLPLIDRVRPETTLAVVLSFFASHGLRCASLLLPRLPSEGSLAPLASAVARGSGRRIEAFGAGCTLHVHRPSGGAIPEVSRDPHLRIERLRRSHQLRDAIETLFVLDAATAKGNGHIPLVRDPGPASFIRTVTRQLARDGRCRVELLRDGDGVVAAALVLEDAQTVWVWRTAAAPEAGASVETLVASAAARARRGNKRLYLADAASLGAEAIERLGFENVDLVDLVLSTRPGLSPSDIAVRLKQRLDRTLRGVTREAFPKARRA